MATRLKIEKWGDEIIPLEMHFFVDSLLLVCIAHLGIKTSVNKT
jgi:hypothetical protein